MNCQRLNKTMTKEIEKTWSRLNILKAKFAMGAMTYDEVKTQMAPLLKTINDKGAKVAKKYKKPYYPLIFSRFIR